MPNSRQAKFGPRERADRASHWFVETGKTGQANQPLGVKLVRGRRLNRHGRDKVIDRVQSGRVREPPTRHLHRRQTAESKEISIRAHTNIWIEEDIDTLISDGLLLFDQPFGKDNSSVRTGIQNSAKCISLGFVWVDQYHLEFVAIKLVDKALVELADRTEDQKFREQADPNSPPSCGGPSFCMGRCESQARDLGAEKVAKRFHHRTVVDPMIGKKKVEGAKRGRIFGPRGKAAQVCDTGSVSVTPMFDVLDRGWDDRAE